MKIVFFGTPDYVLPILNLVHKKYVAKNGDSPIVAVVTASPKPTGRKQYMEFSAVDKWAHEHHIPVFYKADDLVENEVVADLGILESYGEILSEKVIKMFPHGILNAHPSLLPKWRGASPVQATILTGEEITGGTIIKLDEKVDHGPIISQFKEEVREDDTTGTLRPRLFERSGEVLIDLLEPYLAGKITPRPQDDSQATFTKQITKSEGFVDLKKEEPEKIERMIRAFDPWPGVWTTVVTSDKKQVTRKRLKILKAHIEKQINKLTNQPIDSLVLDEVQLEGKNPVSWKQFKEAYPDSNF